MGFQRNLFIVNLLWVFLWMAGCPSSDALSPNPLPDDVTELSSNDEMHGNMGFWGQHPAILTLEALVPIGVVVGVASQVLSRTKGDPAALIRVLAQLEARAGGAEDDQKRLGALVQTPFDLEKAQADRIGAQIRSLLSKGHSAWLHRALVKGLKGGFSFPEVVLDKPIEELSQGVRDGALACSDPNASEQAFLDCAYQQAYQGALLAERVAQLLKQGVSFHALEEFKMLAAGQYGLVAVRKELTRRFKATANATKGQQEEAALLYDTLNRSIDSITQFYTRHPHQLAGSEVFLPATIRWSPLSFWWLGLTLGKEAGIRRHAITGMVTIHYKAALGEEKTVVVPPGVAKDLIANWDDFVVQRDFSKGDWKNQQGQVVPLFRPQIKNNNQVEPSQWDIKQGRVADCYLLATLAAGVSSPQYQAKLQEPEGLVDQGSYMLVRFYWKDESGVVQTAWVPVDKVVDGYLDKKGRFHSGLASVEKALWPLFLEYAYALIHGGSFEEMWGIPMEEVEHLAPAQRQEGEEALKRYAAGEVVALGLISPLDPVLTFFGTSSKAFLLRKYEEQLDFEQPASPLHPQGPLLAQVDPLVRGGVQQKWAQLVGDKAGQVFLKDLLKKQETEELTHGLWLDWITSDQPQKSTGTCQGIQADLVQRKNNPLLEQLMEKLELTDAEKSAFRAATQAFEAEKETQLFNKLKDLFQAKQNQDGTLGWDGIAYAGTPEFRGDDHSGNAGEDLRSIPGLAGMHVYQMTGLVQNGRRLFVRLRNPWGNNIIPTYSDDHASFCLITEWTGEGSFSMPTHDFMRYFNQIVYGGNLP